MEKENCEHFQSVFNTEGVDQDDAALLDAIPRQIIEEINTDLKGRWPRRKYVRRLSNWVKQEHQVRMGLRVYLAKGVDKPWVQM